MKARVALIFAMITTIKVAAAEANFTTFLKRTDAQVLDSYEPSIIYHGHATTVLDCASRCKADCRTFVYAEGTGSCKTLGAGGDGAVYAYSEGDIAYDACIGGRILNNVCYKVMTCSPMCARAAAKQMCSDLWATLAPLRTQAIHSFVNAYQKDLGVFYMHIDGSDAATEDVWLYHDGSEVSYFKWKLGQPMGGTSANDLQLHQNGNMYSARPASTLHGVACAWE